MKDIALEKILQTIETQLNCQNITDEEAERLSNFAEKILAPESS